MEHGETPQLQDAWADPDYIEWWLKKRAWKGPIREMQAEMVARMIPYPLDRAIRVLDLCAGFGALAIAILKSRPKAKAFCIDRSEEMTKLGRDRAASFAERIEFAQASLDTGDWLKSVTGTYDAVVSAQALIRFTTSARRKSLYREIFSIVTPGGCFINLDDVCAPTPGLRKRYNAALDQWLEGCTQQAGGATPQFVKYQEDAPGNYSEPSKDGFLDQELSWLREAGFEDVDCFWKFGVMTVYGGFRPEKPGLMSSFLRVFKS
ncbi:MAG: class I SAM-dependent methyltransferase [Alphaproteobacteria bacterium]